MPEYGYAGEILRVNLADGKTIKMPTAPYAEKHIGGNGIAARLYWEMVPPQAKAYDPENCLICATGPLTGFSGFAGSRWKIFARSPLGNRETFSHCNLGERWGTWLKHAGYDALAIYGKADRPVYIYIRDGKAEIRDASHLWGQTTFDTIDRLKAELGKNVSVMTIGPAGENLIPFATVLAEGGASGSGGMGAVMGSKNLKAVVVAPGEKRPAAAHPDRVRKLIDRIAAAKPKEPMPSMWAVPGLTRDHSCYGCGIGCGRQVYDGEDGRTYKSLCQAFEFYGVMMAKYLNKRNGERLQATRLCDGYGLDTVVIDSMINWLDTCYREGVVSEKDTGIPLSKIGHPEYIEALTRTITCKEGFGDILSRGLIPAAESVGPKSREILSTYVATSGGEKIDYDPRLFITSSLIYATEPRRAIQQLHEICTLLMMWVGMGGRKVGEMLSAENFRRVAAEMWGSELAADYSTYEGKALAAKRVQDRAFAKESLIVCDIQWTLSMPTRYLGSGHAPVTEAEVYSAITGNETDEAELYRLGERNFNMQRAVLLREGWPGREGDRLMEHYHTLPLKKGDLFYNAECLAPGKDGETICKEGAVIDRDKFEDIKSEYYGHRGWDVASGLPTKAKLKELGLDDVSADLDKLGLVK